MDENYVSCAQFINALIEDKSRMLHVDPDTTCAVTTTVTHATVGKSRPHLGLRDGQRLVMVDTPGFDFGRDRSGNIRADLEILREIQAYLRRR